MFRLTSSMNRRKKLSGSGVIFNIYCAAVFIFLIAPLLVVIPISFSAADYLQFPPPGYSTRWYEAYFSSMSWIDATWRSVKVAALTTVLATILGTMMAFSLVRGTYVGKRIVEQLITAPIIMPTIVYAVSAYSLFSTFGLIGRWQGIALAHAVQALPLVVLIVAASLRTFDMALEQAARGLGASWLRAVCHVTVPHIRPALISGAFIAFVSSFDELVIAMFLSGINVTLPKKMFDNIIYEIDPTIAAVSVLQILLVTLALAFVWRLTPNRPSGIPLK